VITIGADGCRGGWICAIREGPGPLAMAAYETFADLLTAWPEAVVAVDMPIGLPAAGPRLCDRLARARLGPRRASVFPAPIRPCLPARTHAEATAARRLRDAKGMSIQAWNIVSKIREVDGLMTAGLQDRVFEAHPELAFAAMDGGCPSRYSKKTAEGRAARVQALGRKLMLAPALLAQRRPSGVANDDLLDAMAILWTADRYVAGAAQRLPESPEVDERGLRMEIWF
jgi:predicted RNase H-like nuclease